MPLYIFIKKKSECADKEKRLVVAKREAEEAGGGQRAGLRVWDSQM